MSGGLMSCGLKSGGLMSGGLKSYDRGAPSTLINKLQRIQNIVARIITGHGRCEHITPVLKSFTGCLSNKGSSLRLLAWCIKPSTTWHRYTYKNYSIHMCHVEDYGPVKRTY